MNINKFSNLQIKCICNEILKTYSNDRGYFYSCKRNSCYYNISNFRMSCVSIYLNKSFEINLNRDYLGRISKGFISNNFNGVYSNNDLILSIENMISIINLCDMNKYIEKYDNLILYK